MDKISDWLFSDKRLWPLALLFIVSPALFYIVKLGLQTEPGADVPWRLIMRQPLFWVIEIGSFLIAVGVVVYLCRQEIRSWLTPLPKDKLVVLIAHFHPVSEATEEESRTVPHRIEQALRKKAGEGVPIDLRSLNRAIEGNSEEERQAAALAIARGRFGTHRAHLVLWGDVREEDEELSITPRIAVARHVGAGIEERPPGEYLTTPAEPDHLTLKQRVAQDLGDLIPLVAGLAHLQNADYERAINLLEGVASGEGQFYLGDALYERGERDADPNPLVERAVAAYESALQINTRETSPEQWAMTQNNLGTALARLGERMEGEDAETRLRQARKAFRAALEVRTPEEMPQDWALTQSNLGAVLGILGERLKGEDGGALLGEAVEACRAALKVYTRETPAQQRARTQNNLGAALTRLGERVKGEGGVALFEDAVEAYRAALKVCTRKSLPQEWAATQNNLGVALFRLGERMKEEIGAVPMGRAVQAFRAALKIRTRQTWPQKWAATQNNLGNVLSCLGMRLNKGALLGEAVQAYRAVLEVYTRETLPQDWALTRNNLGNALRGIGERLKGEGRRTRLIEAIRSYDLALEVFTLEIFPHYHKSASRNRARAQRLLDEPDPPP